MEDKFHLIKSNGDVIEVDSLKITSPPTFDLWPVIGPKFKNKESEPINLVIDRENSYINIKVNVTFKAKPNFNKMIDSFFRGSFKKYRHMWE